MNKEELIKLAKENRVALDGTIQEILRLKEGIAKSELGVTENRGEAIANAQIAVREAESAVMRLGLVLKNVGNPTPYPESYNPESTKVEPTADGLKFGG